MTTGFCPQCGSPRQGSLRFSANCGFDLSTTTVVDASTLSSPPLVAHEPAPAAQAAPTPRTTGSPLLWLMLVPTIIGGMLLGFLTRFDAVSLGVGAFLGAVVGAWLIKLYMQTSNYENLRRIGRR